MSEEPKEPVDAFRAAGVVVMTIVIVFVLLGLGAWFFKDGKPLEDAVKLPLLVIAGLVSLIALLAVMAIAFKTVRLADQSQALGLPDGTVRAVIALSLILIFAVVTVYLFSDLSSTDDVGSTSVSAAVTTSSPNLSPADTRRASKLTASQDFAKQLLIMLGTLITSITSFYFGSKTATDMPRTSPATTSNDGSTNTPPKPKPPEAPDAAKQQSPQSPTTINVEETTNNTTIYETRVSETTGQDEEIRAGYKQFIRGRANEGREENERDSTSS